MENVQVRRSSEDIALQQKPVSIALDRLQRDGVLLSDAVSCWLTLLGTFPPQFKTHLKTIETRAQMVLSDGPSLAAYILDHRFCEAGRSQPQMAMGMKWVEQRGGNEASQQLLLYLGRASPFDVIPFGSTNDVPPAWTWFSRCLGVGCTRCVWGNGFYLIIGTTIFHPQSYLWPVTTQVGNREGAEIGFPFS